MERDSTGMETAWALSTSIGRRVPSDLLIAWLSREVLRQKPHGKVVYDLKLSKVVPETMERAGGKAIVQKSGHTFIKRTMLESGAILGGEYTGHLFYKELDGGDDGLFSALFRFFSDCRTEEALLRTDLRFTPLLQHAGSPDKIFGRERGTH